MRQGTIGGLTYRMEVAVSVKIVYYYWWRGECLVHDASNSTKDC